MPVPAGALAHSVVPSFATKSRSAPSSSTPPSARAAASARFAAAASSSPSASASDAASSASIWPTCFQKTAARDELSS